MTYQQTAFTYAKYNNVEYPFLALAEEAGEVMGKLAKYVRKNSMPLGGAINDATLPILDAKGQTLRVDLISELGDVQWQLAACCTELGVTLEELQENNLSKLEGRKLRGTIVGEGDKR